MYDFRTDSLRKMAITTTTFLFSDTYTEELLLYKREALKPTLRISRFTIRDEKLYKVKDTIYLYLQCLSLKKVNYMLKEA